MGTQVTLKFSDVKVDSAFNMRVSYETDVDTIKEMASNIGANGLLNPPLVVNVGAPGSGKFFLVAGYRRMMAMKELGWTEAMFQVIEADAKHAALINMIENVARKDVTPYEIAARCAQLHEKFGMSGADIGFAAYLSRTYVNALLKIFENLCKPAMKAWKDPANPLHPFCTTDTLARMVRLTDKEQLALVREWERELAGEASNDETDDAGETDGNGEPTTTTTAKKLKARKATEIRDYMLLAKRLEDTAKAQHKAGAALIREALEWALGKRKNIQLIKAYESKLTATDGDKAEVN